MSSQRQHQNRVRNYGCSFKHGAISALLLVASQFSFALSGVNPSLDEISSFADRNCGSDGGVAERKGASTTLELSATAKADLSQLVRKLIGLGIVLKGGVSHSQYEGFLQADLPKVLKDRQDCKIAVIRLVRERSNPTGTRNLSYLKNTSVAFVNMGEIRGLGSIGVAKSVKLPQPVNTINGVGVAIADLAFDNDRRVSSVKIIVSPPNENPIIRSVPVGTPLHIRTQACNQIYVNADRVLFALDSGMSPQSDRPQFDSNGDVICSPRLYKCLVWVAVQGECSAGPKS